MNGTAGKIVAEKVKLAAQANAIFNSIFPSSFSYHPLSFYRWLPISSKEPGDVIEKKLLQNGLRVYHSDRFLAGPRDEQCYLRIALSTAANTDQLHNGLTRLKAVLADMQ
ncbi:MAG: hypothetical protein SOI44_06695 [Lactimicrobium sp.]|jgi:hypothetical protein|uniref:hypothetical protein n=1 Tax=Lactimicrobium sp. TaxID=2563780 RepID=UPI002F35F688